MSRVQRIATALVLTALGFASDCALGDTGVSDGTIAAIARTRRNSEPPPDRAFAESTSRANTPVVATAWTYSDNVGYVHFFVITGPDGERETEVGIELPGDRIAWSFPGLGVVVSPFIKTGVLTAGAKSYDVAHQYGIRPFPDDRSMRVLQQALAQRIAAFVRDKTPYCEENRASDECVTCLGFVLRVLFPGPAFASRALPPDFRSARTDLYTTEDLLLYLAGVPVEAPPAARLKRIESLALPANMRADLQRITRADDAARPAAATETAAAPSRKMPRKPPTIGDVLRRLLPGGRS
jgi:hypothetical protein